MNSNSLWSTKRMNPIWDSHQQDPSNDLPGFRIQDGTSSSLRPSICVNFKIGQKLVTKLNITKIGTRMMIWSKLWLTTPGRWPVHRSPAHSGWFSSLPCLRFQMTMTAFTSWLERRTLSMVRASEVSKWKSKQEWCLPKATDKAFIWPSNAKRLVDWQNCLPNSSATRRTVKLWTWRGSFMVKGKSISALWARTLRSSPKLSP